MNEHGAMGAPLSREGEARRSRMLLELQGAMVRRRERRVMARRAGGAAAVLLVVGVSAVVMMRAPGRARGGAGNPGGASVADVGRAAEVRALDHARGTLEREVATATRVRVIGNQPLHRVIVASGRDESIERHVVVGAKPRLTEEISDDDLLKLLGSTTGDDYGLVRVGGHVELACNTCRAAPPMFLTPPTSR